VSRLCWLLAIAIILAACEPKSAAEPASVQGSESDAEGAVVFELIQAQEAEGQFRLANRASQKISFRGSQASAEGVQPVDAHLKCKTAGSDQWDEGPRPMGDSAASTFELAPGDQEVLIVLWEPGLTEHYAGGSCRVDLRLQDGSIIESGEFSL
jgi:hypothetical protein